MARTGGPSSMGRPNPSSTRPSSPGPTRNNASSRRAITRSPGCKPSISSSGIDNTRSLRNPITCDRIDRPEAVRTSTKSPIDTTGPRDAMSSPTISVTSPIQGSTSMPGTCGTNSRIEKLGGAILALQLVDQSALDFAQLRFHRRVQDALRSLEENFRRVSGSHPPSAPDFSARPPAPAACEPAASSVGCMRTRLISRDCNFVNAAWINPASASGSTATSR